jgi:DNA-binding LytR/AlgR family response regulator
MKNCLIVDDEPLALGIIESYVNEHEQLQLIKKCNTAFDAFEVLHHAKIDLMFLDIKMPGLNGIDFIKSLKDPPAVIFTTAFSEYAAMSYELEAIDYLLKPITLERFHKSLDKFFKLQPSVPTEEKSYTYFKVSGKLVRVEHHDILYAQSIKDYIMLHTVAGNLIVHMTMKYLNELLPASIFIRVHRSYLVNQTHMSVIGKSNIQLKEIVIPVGEHYKDILIQKKGSL